MRRDGIWGNLRHGIRVREGDVVPDVGANVGSPRSSSRGRAARAYGLGSRSGPAQITYYPDAASMSGLYADPQADSAVVRTAMLNSGASRGEVEASLKGRYRGKVHRCELRTLSSVLRELDVDRADLLKIDVEGAELDVLEGIRGEDWPLIRQVVIEVHDRGRRGTVVADELRRRGFRLAIEQEPLMRGTDVHLVYATRV